MQSLNRMTVTGNLLGKTKENGLLKRWGRGEKGEGRESMANFAYAHSSFTILTPSQVLKPRGALTQSLQ